MLVVLKGKNTQMCRTGDLYTYCPMIKQYVEGYKMEFDNCE